MLHAHITAWVIGVILFLIAYNNISDQQGPTPQYKVLHMVLRVFYVIIIVTGIVLFMDAMGIDGMMYGIKFLLGIITIGLMEMTLIKKKKAKKSRGFFIGSIVALILTIALGLHLPMEAIMAIFK
ncbi:YisL family protein [Abyssicoccus albus]|uniref:UPF0344 protein EDD62_0211 n=1 Tax=Abyssicoccus albus TaxID=1817405 RepID=A0A3N5BRC9_9BACL|nr:YisL family protein [Abyssicoccus albus]RPF57590.1 uncharacterized protein DUF1516 [Abyssicoccus albus]